MRDVWSGAALLVVGLAALLEVRRLSVGSVAAPGPGFFPLAIAAALVGVATALMLQGFARRRESAAAVPGPPGGRRRLGTVVTALFTYAFVLTPLGFILSTFLLVLVLLRVVQDPRWPRALGGAAAVAVLAHIVFKAWLGVRLPPGPWGF